MPKSSANRFLFIWHFPTREYFGIFGRKLAKSVIILLLFSEVFKSVEDRESFLFPVSLLAGAGRCGTNLVKLQPKLYQILFTIHMQPPPSPSPHSLHIVQMVSGQATQARVPTSSHLHCQTLKIHQLWWRWLVTLLNYFRLQDLSLSPYDQISL